jgi:serine/threonine protein kinase
MGDKPLVKASPQASPPSPPYVQVTGPTQRQVKDTEWPPLPPKEGPQGSGIGSPPSKLDLGVSPTPRKVTPPRYQPPSLIQPISGNGTPMRGDRGGVGFVDTPQSKPPTRVRQIHLLGDLFHIQRELGNGTSATTYLASVRSTSQFQKNFGAHSSSDLETEMAIKIFHQPMPPGQSIEDSPLLSEIQLLMKIRHPHVIPIYGAWIETRGLSAGKLCIAMKYCGRGDLERWIKAEKQAPANRRETFSFPQFAHFAGCLLSAVGACHQAHILHRDIKPENIFLRNVFDPVKLAQGILFEPVLGDLGISKELDNTISKTETFCGTPYFMSPEVFSGAPYGLSADIWSVGVTLFHMLAAARPFRNSKASVDKNPSSGNPAPIRHRDVNRPGLGDFTNLFDNILHYDPIPELWYSRKYLPKFSEADFVICVDLIKNCIHKDPSCRPSAKHLLQHPVFADWRGGETGRQLPPLRSPSSSPLRYVARSSNIPEPSLTPEQEKKTPLPSDRPPRPSNSPLRGPFVAPLPSRVGVPRVASNHADKPPVLSGKPQPADADGKPPSSHSPSHGPVANQGNAVSEGHLSTALIVAEEAVSKVLQAANAQPESVNEHFLLLNPLVLQGIRLGALLTALRHPTRPTQGDGACFAPKPMDQGAEGGTEPPSADLAADKLRSEWTSKADQSVIEGLLTELVGMGLRNERLPPGNAVRSPSVNG